MKYPSLLNVAYIIRSAFRVKYYETGSLKDEALYKDLHQRLQTLGKKLNRFIQSVEREHRTEA